MFVAIGVQFEGDRPGLDSSVTRKNGVVLRTTTELVVVLAMLAKTGAVGVGSSPTLPLKVTPAVNAKALPSIVLLVFIVMD